MKPTSHGTEDDVWDEEDRARDFVLMPSYADIKVHAFDLCIADVPSVNMRKQVQDAHDGYQYEVDLRF